MKLKFSNEWLRRKISAGPDVELQAGPELGSGGLESRLGHARAITERGNPTEAELQREWELSLAPSEGCGHGTRKLPVRYD